MQSASPPIAAAEKIAPPLLSLVFTKFYDWFLGKTYSKKNRQHLETLKAIYSKHFKTAPLPENFTLDGDNRPVRYFQGFDFTTYAAPSVDESNKPFFHYNAEKISMPIIYYLNSRLKRTFGRGAQGDLVEQFLGEWLQWSTHSLPNMSYSDPNTVTKLQKRLDYINEVIGNIYLFNFSALPTRKNNKNLCFQIIKQNLEHAIELAQQEKLRTAARELLDATRTDMSKLLVNCLEMIFFTRKYATDCNTLNIRSFLENSHPTILKTYTGEMLHEVISRAGQAAFSLHKNQTSDASAHKYFDGEYKPAMIAWGNTLVNDSPSWVTDEKQKKQFVISVQNIGAAILRYAEIKTLVEEAYDLAGSRGNQWAYSNETGKRAIQALIYLHNVEVKKLREVIELFYTTQDALRVADMDKNKNKPKNPSTLNFEHISKKWPSTTELFQKLNNEMAELDQQQRNFPEDGETLINEQQQRFYQRTNAIFNYAHPDQAARFHLDSQISALTIYAHESLKTTIEFIETRFNLPFNGFELSKPKNAKYATFHNEIAKIHNPNNIPAEWHLGDDYQDWAENFFTRHKTLFANFSQLEQQYHQAIGATAAEEIIRSGEQMKKTIAEIYKIARDERPQWRFKYLIWPVTKGYPFNQSADKFAEMLIIDLRKQFDKIREHEKQAVQFIYDHNPNPREGEHSTSQVTQLLRQHSHRSFNSPPSPSSVSRSINPSVNRSVSLPNPSTSGVTFHPSPTPAAQTPQPVSERAPERSSLNPFA